MPPIYHITHIANLASIIEQGRLWSDARRIALGLANTNIGYSHIKSRRLRHPVGVSALGTLGQYVPFNFCPRSVMLYVVSKGHADYGGDQGSVLHLVSSVATVLATGRPHFFTDRHADLGYARQFDDLTLLADEVDWAAMPVRQWGGDQDLKERRQAEFLVHDWLPWEAVEEIGVMSPATAEAAQAMLADVEHKPHVVVRRDWYY